MLQYDVFVSKIGSYLNTHKKKKKKTNLCQASSQHTHLSKSEISGRSRHYKRLVVDQCLCVRHSITCISSHQTSNFHHKESSAWYEKPETLCTQGKVSVTICRVFGENMWYILRIHLFTSSVKSTVSPI